MATVMKAPERPPTTLSLGSDSEAALQTVRRHALRVARQALDVAREARRLAKQGAQSKRKRPAKGR
jgi:hypothetical protein